MKWNLKLSHNGHHHMLKIEFCKPCNDHSAPSPHTCYFCSNDHHPVKRTSRAQILGLHFAHFPSNQNAQYGEKCKVQVSGSSPQLLLADPRTDEIITTCNERILRSVSVVCYHGSRSIITIFLRWQMRMERAAILVTWILLTVGGGWWKLEAGQAHGIWRELSHTLMWT